MALKTITVLQLIDEVVVLPNKIKELESKSQLSIRGISLTGTTFNYGILFDMVEKDMVEKIVNFPKF